MTESTTTSAGTARKTAMNKIICGDALESLASLPAKSVHLVVTSAALQLGDAL